MRHELGLARRGLTWLVVASAALVAVGAVTAGARGALSAGAASLLVGLNHLAAAASTGWSRRLGPGVIAAGYAAFVLRMFAVFAALAALVAAPWAHRGLMAFSFVTAMGVMLTAECLSYARRSYVPEWRAAR